jgi:hypothetical protein
MIFGRAEGAKLLLAGRQSCGRKDQKEHAHYLSNLAYYHTESRSFGKYEGEVIWLRGDFCRGVVPENLVDV